MPNDRVRVTIHTTEGTKTVEAERGTLLLETLHGAGAVVATPCGGRGTCGKCAVVVEDVGRVLSCRFAVEQDMEVHVPSSRRAEILRTAGALKPVANECGVMVDENGAVVSTIPGAERVIAPSASSQAIYGIAIDIGTTTVVVYLEDLVRYESVDVESFVNPQTKHGHDVVSRIHHTMEHENGLDTLQGAIRDAIHETVHWLCARNGIVPDSVYKATVVGNTTMLHLFMGEDPSPIAAAPYTPRFVEQKVLDGEQAQIGIHRQGGVLVLPSVSAYVGADITAGIAATDMLDRDDHTLFVDIGTNGEMALGNRHSLHCCSTAAGPAFEGATIRCGIGGVEGAISSYDGGEYCTIGALPPVGICGSGILDIAAALRANGTVDAGGFMEEHHTIVPVHETGHGEAILFTPEDVREVQLATAAIYAGIRILAKESGVGLEGVSQVYLAGGFGNYLRVASAIAIGLLPASLENRIVPVGNSAGSGSRLALRSVPFTAEVNRVASRARYIELSMRMDFNEEYVLSMSLESRG